eukprot:g1287.t1
MGKGTTLVLLLTTTLVLAVKARVDEDCLERYSDTIDSIAEGDDECTAAFIVLTTEDIDVDCTSDVKKRIRRCLDTYEEEWNDFVALCENVETRSALAAPAAAPTEEDSSTLRSTSDPPPTEESDSPTTVEITPSSVSTDVAEPVSSSVSDTPIMDAAETPTDTDWVTDSWDDLPETAMMSVTSIPVSVSISPPSDEPMVSQPDTSMEPMSMPESTEEPMSEMSPWYGPMVDSESPVDDSMASEPSPARRLSRRLLIELEKDIEEADVITNALDPIMRSLLQSENPTCRELLIQEGPEAFTNNAASVRRISLLSLIGSILLGFMLV